MKKIALVVAAVWLLGALHANAANTGDIVTFTVDQNYDSMSRSSLPATLVKITPGLYFYVETSWWTSQSSAKKNEVLANFDLVSDEFSNSIYPKLTGIFGGEANPGIDRDNKISLLFESTADNLGGYFRSADGYSRLQVPGSNEREMLYLPLAQIASPQLKMYLAHEFTHLITFNQKDLMRGVSEETWLNEARADYVSTFLGYDNNYDGSNLQHRMQDFLVQPTDALTEWRGAKYDYAALNMFTHYLVDHYGLQILSDSLKAKSTGIASINEALSAHGFKEDFAQIFTNWTIATVINNCSAGPLYCYTSPNLVNLKINPSLIFLPLTGDSSLSLNNTTKNWAGSWQKIIGGNGDLLLQFSGMPGLVFKIPYIVYDKANNYTVSFLTIDTKGKGQITIKDFGNNYNALVVIPSLQSLISASDNPQSSYPYTFTISITGPQPQEDPALIQNLLAQIESLKKQIAALQKPAPPAPTACALDANLYAGVSDSSGVTCLQKFLAGQGPEIYPEGLVTGFFGTFTRAAVVRFQAKYRIVQTGFVGILTRTKINEIIHGR